MTWGDQDCSPDGYTPDGAPCVPDTNTPPNNPTPPTPPGNGGCGDGSTPIGGGPGVPGGYCRPWGSDSSGNGDGGFGEFQFPDYTPFDYSFDPGDAPRFTAPKFNPTNFETLKDTPAFKFRLSTGLGALQNSAAARGVLRSGGTLKGFNDYGQQMASQEIDNQFGRDVDAYKLAYQGARDEYQPLLETYRTRNQARQHSLDMTGADWMRKYLSDMDLAKYVLGLA